MKKKDMPRAIVKFKDKEALEALIRYSKTRPIIIEVGENADTFTINGVTLSVADDSIDTKELEAVFSHRGSNAKKIRQDTWQRSR